MRTHRKPDLLFILAVIAGFGVIVSSYIQYERANANAPDASTLVVKQELMEKSGPDSSFILVSSQPQASIAKEDPVNNSLPRP